MSVPLSPGHLSKQPENISPILAMSNPALTQPQKRSRSVSGAAALTFPEPSAPFPLWRRAAGPAHCSKTVVVPCSERGISNQNGKRKTIGIKGALQLLDAYAAIPIRMAEVGLKQAVELSARWNVHAYDAYVLACAVNQRAPP